MTTQLDPTTTRLLLYGADIAGAAAGFAVEYLQKAPPGFSGPVAVAVAVTLKEIAHRVLSSGEQARVGGAAAYAVNLISARLVAGHVLRSDDFTLPRNSARPPSEELFEAMLLRARDAYEERKVRHIGLFFANIAFAQNISFETANLLLQLLGQITYRQLCLLALVAKQGRRDMESLRRYEHDDVDAEALKREEMNMHGNDLGTLGLLSGDGTSWFDVPSTLGATLYELASLDQIAVEDLASIDDMLVRISNQRPAGPTS